MDYLKKSKTFFVLIVTLLVGITLFVYSQVSFIFEPLRVIAQTLFLPMLLSLFVFYAFLPIYRFVYKQTGRQNLAILGVYIIFVFTIILFVLMIAPILVEEISSFIRYIPSLGYQITRRLQVALAENNISSAQLAAKLQELDISFSQTLRNIMSNISFGISSTLSITVTFMMLLFIVPVILYYLYKDGQRGIQHLERLTPERYRPLMTQLLRIIHENASAYIGGRLLVCLFVAVASYVVFRSINLPYAILLGFICGVFDIIPYFGPFIGVVPALLLALIDSWFATAVVVIFITIVQLIESYIVSPFVMEKSLSLHPLTTIFVLLVSGNLFGVTGMILALPVYVIVRECTLAIYRFFKRDKYNSQQVSNFSLQNKKL